MKSVYGQFCPVAVASEMFAERWTPVILRELVKRLRSRRARRSASTAERRHIAC